MFTEQTEKKKLITYYSTKQKPKHRNGALFSYHRTTYGFTKWQFKHTDNQLILNQKRKCAHCAK